jgi:hypothetical protein
MPEETNAVRTLAGRAELAAAWAAVYPGVATYLAATGSAAPVDPDAAATWLLQGGRMTFCRRCAGLPVVSSIERHRAAGGVGRLLVVSPCGADFPGVRDVVADLVELAFHHLGRRRCEWRILATWERARAAASELGFQEEARYGEACFAQGRFRDVVLAGMMAGEWAAR